MFSIVFIGLFRGQLVKIERYDAQNKKKVFISNNGLQMASNVYTEDRLRLLTLKIDSLVIYLRHPLLLA